MRLIHVVPVAAAAAALTLSAAACGDSVGANTITMTNAEVQEVFAEMTDALSGTGAPLDRTHGTVALPARAPSGAFATAENINVTAACTNGGSVAVSGSVNANGTTGASFNVTETFTSCQTEHFTLGGPIKFNGTVTTTETGFTFNETIKGNMSVSHDTDGRSGNCAIDFTVNGSFGGQTSTVTATGTICGVNASGVATL